MFPLDSSPNTLDYQSSIVTVSPELYFPVSASFKFYLKHFGQVISNDSSVYVCPAIVSGWDKLSFSIKDALFLSDSFPLASQLMYKEFFSELCMNVASTSVRGKCCTAGNLKRLI